MTGGTPEPPHQPRRERLAEDAAHLVTQLLDSLDAAETIDWRPTREGLNLPAGAPLPKPQVRRHLIHARGLLPQLHAEVGEQTATGDTSIHTAPTSTPPPGSGPAETITILTGRIRDTYLRACRQAGKTPTRRTAHDQARALPGLLLGLRADGSHDLSDDDAYEILHDLRAWVGDTRVDLGWDAPTITIPDATCPECLHTGTLRVAADATTDVRCTARPVGPPRPGEPYPRRCTAIWPRHTWMQLLDEMTARERAS